MNYVQIKAEHPFDWDISHQSEITTSYEQLVKIFGQPVGESDGHKVAYEWLIKDDEGNCFTIYDYELTTLYYGPDEAYEPWELQRLEEVEWHIGGKDANKAEAFKKWLEAKIQSDPIEWVELIVDVEAVRVRVPKKAYDEKNVHEISLATQIKLKDKTPIENYQLEEDLG